MTDNDILTTIIVSTSTILLVVSLVVSLLVVNTNRRIRHHAELAAMQAAREREVTAAEREATQQTLREVGRELHDNVGQLLSATQQGLMITLGERPDARLQAALDALDQGVMEVKRLGRSLNSELWQQRSLVDAISVEADRLERVGRMRAHVEVKGQMPSWTPDTSIILFRVFQEVVNNALKHSGADTLTIALDAGPPFVLTVTDNGQGFDPQSTTGNGGLHNIRHRCGLIGFEAHCASSPEKGCKWTIKQKS